jgi:hypothetical protein
MAVKIKVGGQSRISTRPWRSGSRWGTVKDINQAMAVRINVGYSQGYQPGHGVMINIGYSQGYQPGYGCPEQGRVRSISPGQGGQGKEG